MPLLTASLLTLTTLLSTSFGQQNVLNDTAFYGQSPDAPAPIASGTGSWAEAYAKARAALAMLSLDEKVNLTGGVVAPNGCSGNIPSIDHIGFEGMCLTDAGNGVRATDFANGWPSGIHVGASWNKDLANQRAKYLGGEFRTKGVHVALGPVVGPLGRVSEGGRNWEGFSNDPYLCGQLAYETVSGMQSTGVITSTKHYIFNEQETNRNPIEPNSFNGLTQTQESVSSNVDDRTLHELYLWPFQDAVHAGTGSVMCSYNRINNSYGCQNSYTLNHVLKTELGYQGFVVSDWYAQHAGVASANAGLDMVMPTGATYWAGNLTEAVTNGSVAESRIDDIATRILAAWYQMGQDSGYPERGVGMPLDILAPHEIVDARNPAAKPYLLQGAIEGHVLVKNTNGALPLRNPKLLSLYGYSATSAKNNNPPAAGGFGAWTLGAGSADVDAIFCAFVGTPCPPFTQIAGNGTIISGGGSGAVTPPYISAPLDALVEYSYQNDVALFWDFINVNATSAVDGASSACIVFLNAWASEGVDRVGIEDEYSDNLVNNIADQCSNTIVVIHNAGVRLVDGFYDHPNVTAIIYAHLPGQDSGRALVEILSGSVSPSGRLPYTVGRKSSDYGAILSPVQPQAPYEYFPQDNFTEGIQIDYRAYDANNIEPRFEFGYGLTYTTFSYSGLTVTSSNSNTGQYPTGQILEGGKEDLWDVLYTATATVTNTGNFAAAEVAQLYISIPNAGVGRQLRGFVKQEIAIGGSAQVSFDITRRDMSVWDVVAQDWSLQNGSYIIEVGSSSRNLPLSMTTIVGGGSGSSSGSGSTTSSVSAYPASSPSPSPVSSATGNWTEW